MNYSILDNITVEILAAGILAFVKIIYMYFKPKKDEKILLEKKPASHKSLTWTPKIVTLIVEAQRLGMSAKNTLNHLKVNLSDDEFNILFSKFISKAEKKEVSVESLVTKRVGDILKEAEEISNYGEDNLNDWIHNRNNARSFVWRSEKKKEYAQKNKSKRTTSKT
jgi:hypothetical protein